MLIFEQKLDILFFSQINQIILMYTRLLLLMCVVVVSSGNSYHNKVRSIYGFSKKINQFKDHSDKAIIDTLKSWNVNAIFGRSCSNRFIEMLHEADIKYFVEVGFFVGKKYWGKYPQSRPITVTGEKLLPEEWYAGVNPCDRNVQREIFNKIADLINTTKVDGIWLDFIRWPCHWEGENPKLIQTSYDSFTVAKFLEDCQLTAPKKITDNLSRNKWILQKHFDVWTDWKCAQITNIVRDVRKIVDAAPRKIIVGMFGVPWRNGDFNGAIRTIIGQDYKALAEHVDVFSPMVYHVMCGEDVKWVGDVTEWVAEMTERPVVPIIQAMDYPTILSPKEFEQAIKIGLGSKSSDGVIVFKFDSLKQKKLTILKKMFNQ